MNAPSGFLAVRRSARFSRTLFRTCLPVILCGAAVAAQSVTLTDNGSTVTLANGIVSVVIDKSNGLCTDLREIGGPNLLANGGRIYFDTPGNGFAPQLYDVVTSTSSQRSSVDRPRRDTSATCTGYPQRGWTKPPAELIRAIA